MITPRNGSLTFPMERGHIKRCIASAGEPAKLQAPTRSTAQSQAEAHLMAVPQGVLFAHVIPGVWIPHLGSGAAPLSRPCTALDFCPATPQSQHAN